MFRVSSLIDSGEEAGAKLIVDGRDVQARGGQEGFWLGPTLFDNVTPEMEIYREEIFGPVLSVVRVQSYEEALDLVAYVLAGGDEKHAVLRAGK